MAGTHGDWNPKNSMPKKTTKADLIRETSLKSGFYLTYCDKVIREFLYLIPRLLRNQRRGGVTIELRGFGVFLVRNRVARVGRNIRYPAEVLIPPTRTIVLKFNREVTFKINREKSNLEPGGIRGPEGLAGDAPMDRDRGPEIQETREESRSAR